jgi:hypothetical protein
MSFIYIGLLRRGLLGLGAVVALKYMYPSLKKFFVRRYGRNDVMDPRFRDQIMLNLPEITHIMSSAIAADQDRVATLGSTVAGTAEGSKI